MNSNKRHPGLPIRRFPVWALAFALGLALLSGAALPASRQRPIR